MAFNITRLACAWLASIISMLAQPSPNTQVPIKQVPVPLPVAVARLGQAIYSVKGDEAGSSCVEFNKDKDALGENKAPRTEYFLRNLETQEDVMEAFGAKITAGYGSPQTGVDAEVNRTKTITRSSSSRTIALILTVENEPYFRELKGLNLRGKEAWSAGTPAFYLKCGDTWTKQVFTGGRLIGLLTTSLSTVEEKERVDATLGVRAPSGNVGFKGFSDILNKAKSLKYELRVLREGTAQPASTTIEAFLAEATQFPILVTRGTGGDRVLRIEKGDYSEVLGMSYTPPTQKAEKSLAVAAPLLFSYESELDRAGIIMQNADLFEPFAQDFATWSQTMVGQIAKLRNTIALCQQNTSSACAALDKLSGEKVPQFPQPVLRYQARVYLGIGTWNLGMLSVVSPIRHGDTQHVGYLLTEAAAKRVGQSKPIFQEPSDSPRDPGRLWTANFAKIAGYVLNSPNDIQKLGPTNQPVVVYSITRDFVNLVADHYLHVTSTRAQFDGILDESCRYYTPQGVTGSTAVQVCSNFGYIPMFTAR